MTIMNQDIASLVQFIYNALAVASPAHANFWFNNFQESIVGYTDESEALKRVNLFWHIQLAKADADLFDVRNYLSDDIPIKVWQKRFVSKVIPSIIKHIKT